MFEITAINATWDGKRGEISLSDKAGREIATMKANSIGDIASLKALVSSDEQKVFYSLKSKRLHFGLTLQAAGEKLQESIEKQRQSAA